MKCEYCGKKLKGKQRKYCSNICSHYAQRKKDPARYKRIAHNYYLRNKQKYIKNARKWDKLNPEKKKESSKKSCLKFRTEKRERFNELVRNCQRRRLKIKPENYRV